MDRETKNDLKAIPLFIAGLIALGALAGLLESCVGLFDYGGGL